QCEGEVCTISANGGGRGGLPAPHRAPGTRGGPGGPRGRLSPRGWRGPPAPFPPPPGRPPRPDPPQHHLGPPPPPPHHPTHRTAHAFRLTGEADARTRTGDPFITSEVLYQLSYVGGAPRLAGCRFDSPASGPPRDRAQPTWPTPPTAKSVYMLKTVSCVPPE